MIVGAPTDGMPLDWVMTPEVSKLIRTVAFPLEGTTMETVMVLVRLGMVKVEVV